MEVLYVVFCFFLHFALLFISVYDIITMRIPNVSVVFLSALGLLRSAYMVDGSFFESCAAALFICVVMLLVKKISSKITGENGLGGGDVKFASACGLFFQFSGVWVFFILTGCFGIIAIGIRNLVKLCFGARGEKKGKYVPLAPAIAAAFEFVYFFG
ncbi:A24 family peptidase [Candidatus Hydrogenosomobacter endosymbioticus]|uniref:Prepilin type IV endopeptidase peptidase domain-containing protein n=1 Tax=Candidatus Hydrogenosomobacter endosymbioticus TaxID=2558174 RepID=A0ABM7V8M7_9PROT|nr:A24 family peptidase [Candidatus Hydrogenosomobacter endosymbioticus]BDB96140.1 hypothetical protein HYD_2730 [Candidatus Hydrogenosomobacter endosymbioticus]